MTKKKPLREILAENVIWLMDNNPDLDTQEKVAERSGGVVSQQHVGRVRAGKLSIGLDVVDGLAKAFGCEPWELLVDADTSLEEAWRRVATRPPRPQASGNVLQIPKRRRRSG